MEKRVYLPASLPHAYNYIHESSNGTKYYIWVPEDIDNCYIIHHENGVHIKTTYLLDGTAFFIDDAGRTVILNVE